MKKIKLLLFIITIICFLSIFNSVNAVEELPDNGATISSSQIIQTKTGTGPFDENDDPGNDSSEDNNVVRSFDQVTWTVENTMVINNADVNSYTGGRIYFEAKLPSELNSSTAKWDLESMIWIEEPQVSDDGMTLTGYYQMSTSATTIPGKQTLVFVVSILGASNETEFQPEFSIWLNGNEESDYKKIVPDKIKVSAAPRYNVKITQNSNLKNKMTVDYGEGDTLGRMYGYGILLQLYNENSSKGLKGIEYPTGEITFDIDMKLERTEFESTEREDITDDCTPVLWNYKVNDLNNYGVIPDRIMNFGNGYNRYQNNMPLGVIHNERRYSVYNSGDYTIEQEGDILHVTVKNYEFDGTFPIWNYGWGALGTSIVYPQNIGCFSVGYFQIFVPDNYSSTMEDRNYYLTLSDINFNATSVSGANTNTQMVTSDDATTVNHVIYKDGTYSQSLYFQDYYGGYTIESRGGAGDGFVSLGQNFTLLMKFGVGVTNDFDIYSATKFLKFDGSAFEPILTSRKTEYYKASFAGDMEFNVWYVTKPDGTNWSDKDEMINANVEDMLVFDTIEEIPEGYVCVGEYIESTTGVLTRTTGDNNNVYVSLKVKEDAKIGETYGFVQRTKMWKDYLDRDVYTITNKDVTLPTPTWDFGNRDYIKTEYDENGKFISGTHSGGNLYGNSLLVIAADLGVEKISVDEYGNEKVNYDISKNEYDITYKISPILNKISNVNVEINNVTIKLTDTLPAGLKYVTGSCDYGEPEIKNNSDGSTTLVWYIYNCEVGKEIEPIYYQAHIDESTVNGTQFTNSVVIFADPDKVGNITEDKRTSTYTNQIINLASHRLYKTVEKESIELNDEIKYTLTYKNNTDGVIPDFQLLDVLPYNGDSRGTNFNGSYKLNKIEVLRYDKNNNPLSQDGVEIYYINNNDIRNDYSSKDDFLNQVDGWNLVDSNETINNYATAIALKGTATEQERIEVNIYLTPENNEVEDVYCNLATAQTNLNTEELTSSIVKAQVISRELDGFVFIDKDYDSVYTQGKDELVKNAEVTIVNENNEQVNDVYGNILTTIRTDEEGYYSFKNLPKGNYRVLFKILDNRYQAVEKEVGSNVTINSKINADFSTDIITALNSDSSSKLVVSNVNAGFVKKETKVIVNYKEIGTDKVLSNEVTINGRIDDEYSTENKLDEINANNDNKYEYVRVEGTTEGQMTEDTIYVTYWYQKKAANVKVLHVLEGTDVSNPESVTDVLYPTEELTGRVDDSYSTQNRLSEINENSQIEYELVEDNVANKTGQMTVDTIYVVYEYRTIPATIKIEHKDIDTDEELMDTVTENGLVGESYTTENRLDEINEKYDNKYELVSEPGNKDGKYKKEEQIITYYYQKKMGEVEVNYLEVGTEKVLASQEILKDKVDKEYTTVNKLDEINAANEDKYEFVKTTGDATEGVYKVEKQVVNYYYQKKAANVKVLHVLEGTDVSDPESVTDVLYPTEELTGRVDDSYSTQNRLSEINENSQIEYELVEDNVANKTGQMTVDTIYVVYEYRTIPATIKIEHKDIDTDEELMDTVTENGLVGESYTTENRLDEINEKYDNKYELVSEPGNKDGEYKKEEQTITYYYRKKPAKVVVKYVDVDTEEELIEGEEIVGKIDDEYTTIDKIDKINENRDNKYVLVKTTENTSGKMEEETIEVIYYYKKIEAQVIVKHIDEDTGEEIAEREYIGGYVGDRYTTSDKEIEGYELVIERIPTNKEGNMEEEIIEVIYYYRKIQEVVNIDTGDIAVMVVAGVAVVCVAGIVYVVIRNKKKNTK